mmetsp:Transcript_12836/g.24099  ORF Transcript_12836/g.24099 Transcript_12836/m.24099 type:complete len:117 (-) Transcript_12836:8-358(-)
MFEVSTADEYFNDSSSSLLFLFMLSSCSVIAIAHISWTKKARKNLVYSSRVEVAEQIFYETTVTGRNHSKSNCECIGVIFIERQREREKHAKTKNVMQLVRIDRVCIHSLDFRAKK